MDVSGVLVGLIWMSIVFSHARKNSIYLRNIFGWVTPSPPATETPASPPLTL